MCQTLGGSAPFFGEGERGPHLTQSRLGRGLPPYKLASWSMQSFGRNGYGPKLGGLCPFGGGGDGSPSNTMWPQPRPTCTTDIHHMNYIIIPFFHTLVLISIKIPVITKNYNYMTTTILNHFTAIIHINLCQPAPLASVKNWKILMQQSFTACMTLPAACSTFGSGRDWLVGV